MPSKKDTVSKNLERTEIASELNIKRSTLSDVLHGKTSVTDETLTRIADEFYKHDYIPQKTFSLIQRGYSELIYTNTDKPELLNLCRQTFAMPIMLSSTVCSDYYCVRSYVPYAYIAFNKINAAFLNYFGKTRIFVINPQNPESATKCSIFCKSEFLALQFVLNICLLELGLDGLSFFIGECNGISNSPP